MATLVDSLGAEDRVHVKYSDYFALVKAAEAGKILKNAIYAETPYAEVRKMLSGENDELEEYRKTELTPDQIREIDHLYSEKCIEVATLTAELNMLREQTRAKADALEKEQP